MQGIKKKVKPVDPTIDLARCNPFPFLRVTHTETDLTCPFFSLSLWPGCILARLTQTTRTHTKTKATKKEQTRHVLYATTFYYTFSFTYFVFVHLRTQEKEPHAAFVSSSPQKWPPMALLCKCFLHFLSISLHFGEVYHFILIALSLSLFMSQCLLSPP